MQEPKIINNKFYNIVVAVLQMSVLIQFYLDVKETSRVRVKPVSKEFQRHKGSESRVCQRVVLFATRLANKTDLTDW